MNEIRLTPEFQANAEMQAGGRRSCSTAIIPAPPSGGLSNEGGETAPRRRCPNWNTSKPSPSLWTIHGRSSARWSATFPPPERVPDWLGMNAYPGWYVSAIPADEMTRTIAQMSKAFGKRIAVSEYGAGGSPFQREEGALHQPRPAGPFHPEEWQTLNSSARLAADGEQPAPVGDICVGHVRFRFQSAARGLHTRPE